MNSRIRGFEKISFKQWLKDAWNITYEDFKSSDDTSFKNKILISYEKIQLPSRATSKSAGYDVFSTCDIYLEPNQDIKIPTGWKAYMQEDEKIVFHPRSGLGFKYYLRLANTTGVGDSDYYDNEGNEGHYWVKIRNEGLEPLSIEKGKAIAQCIFEKYLLADGDTYEGNKRIGGFGSTG